MTPLAENPHVTIRVDAGGHVLTATNNITPELKIKVCHTLPDFNLAKRGDSYNGGIQNAYEDFDPEV